MSEGNAAGEGVKAEKNTNPIRDSAILQESIKREQKFHRLYCNYTVTPSVKKNFVMSQKPNTVSIRADEKEDAEYLSLSMKMTKSPREKYSEPQTSGQEYGWDTSLLVAPMRDRRFYHPKVSCEITKYYGFASKSQDKKQTAVKAE